MADLLDYLNIPKAVFIGHDWGGALVWRMCLFYPSRVLAVAGLCTPFTPRLDTFLELEQIVERLPAFAYQLFLVSDAAAPQLDAQAESFFRLILRSSAKDDRSPSPFSFGEDGALTLEHAELSLMISPSVLSAYVEAYRRSGFAGGLNWYKTRRVNWEEEAGVPMRITHDALMLTANKDPVLSPKMSAKMEETVPNMSRASIENAAHWVQVEQPTLVNRPLLVWLSSLGFPSASSRL